MSYDKTSTLIKRHEGFRDSIYKDTLGNLTVGYGCHLYEGKPISKGVCERLFLADYSAALDDFGKLDLELDPVRKAVVVDMIFNMGLAKFRKFRITLDAIRNGKYELAAAHMEQSRWHNQVGIRATTLEQMMRTGEWPEWIR